MEGQEIANIYSYKRISTKESNDKQSYARQQNSLKFYAKENKLEYILEFQDDVTGSTFNRPNWNKLESLVQEGDTIVFKEISRLTREAKLGYDKYMELMNKGINLVFIDNLTVSTDYIRKLTDIAENQNLVTKTALQGTIKLLLIVELDRVQQEREIIVKRIKQGIAESPKKSGRKKNTLDKMTNELREHIIEYLGDRSIKQVDIMKKHGISRNTLKKYIAIVGQAK